MRALSYICKYTPLELLRSFDVEATLLDGEPADLTQAESRTHANLCCHAKAVFQLAGGGNAVFFTDCCDSMRRVRDALASQDPASTLPLMELPHEDTGCARERLSRELVRIARWLEKETRRAFDARAFVNAFDDDGTGLPDGPFIAIMGARAPASLKEATAAAFSIPIIDLTCASHREITPAPAKLANQGLEEAMEWYAGALLGMIPCMRMTDVARRRELLERPGLAAIVYNTVKFCDYYGFDYLALKDETTLPILKVETDYQPLAAGQLATRLEALAELVDDGNTHQGDARESQRARKEHAMYAGIDSGSTTTNMVVIDEDGSVIASSIVRTGAKAQNGARAALEDVCAQLGIDAAGLDAVMATGYGRANIPFATDTMTEITCHAKGVHHLDPSIRAIVDIGGQDSKVICLDEEGGVANFVMNDKCAAGTGRFLEAMARTLEIDLDQMAHEGMSFGKDVTISSMCTVFAESEVISLIADNVAEADIVHGLNKSIAARTASMASRAKAQGPFMMTGGVARNLGVVDELSKALGAPIAVPDDPDLCGALGAALFARERDLG